MPTLSSLFSKSGFLKWDGAGNATTDFTTEDESDLAADAALTGAFAPLNNAVLDRPIAGSWLVTPGVTMGNLTLPAPGANAPTGCWIFVPYTTPVDRIGLTVTVAGAAGDTMALVLYKKQPGSTTLDRVFAETSPLDISTTGDKEATISATLAPGRYAALVRSVVITGAPQVRCKITTGTYPGHYPVETTERDSEPWGGIHGSQIGYPSGALPATLTLVPGVRSVAPHIYLRAA